MKLYHIEAIKSYAKLYKATLKLHKATQSYTKLLKATQSYTKL